MLFFFFFFDFSFLLYIYYVRINSNHSALKYDHVSFLTKGDWSNIDVRGVANKMIVLRPMWCGPPIPTNIHNIYIWIIFILNPYIYSLKSIKRTKTLTLIHTILTSQHMHIHNMHTSIEIEYLLLPIYRDMYYIYDSGYVDTYMYRHQAILHIYTQYNNNLFIYYFLLCCCCCCFCCMCSEMIVYLKREILLFYLGFVFFFR